MICISDIQSSELDNLLGNYGLKIHYLSLEDEIPGSYWGAPEAGIITNNLYVRPDTPVHSALHESCHFVCMDSQRREKLHTDTGGDYDEENAVCYLQIVLAQHLSDASSSQLCHDMDDWGYTFRLGSAKKWFEEDAEDALQWLQSRNILDEHQQASWNICR